MSYSGRQTMKGGAVLLKYRLLLAASVLFFLFAVASAHAEENKFRLKMGASGKICLNCHVDLQNTIKNPFIHTPVKAGECSGCHNPHTSSHGKLLAADADNICYT